VDSSDSGPRQVVAYCQSGTEFSTAPGIKLNSIVGDVIVSVFPIWMQGSRVQNQQRP
jgi:hypothetical protein